MPAAESITPGNRLSLSLALIQNCPGNDLFSQAVAHQLLSALRRLTALFGMGRSGTTAQKSPGQFWIPFDLLTLTLAYRAKLPEWTNPVKE